MDKLIFPIPESEEAPATSPNSESLKDLAAGKYDSLFPGASDKPSDLYRAAQGHPPTPSVRLAKNLAIQPLEFALPKYPPLARVAHIQGDVIFKFEIGQDGGTSNYTLVTGHPLLSPSVKDAVERWKLPPATRGNKRMEP
jgi:protein TonB